MAITTGGGIGYDGAGAAQQRRAQNMQSLQNAIGMYTVAEQKAREQSLATGAQQFANLITLGEAAEGGLENYLASEAGKSSLFDIQQQMSRATGKKLSPDEAMQGAYVAASKYYGENQSLASKMRQSYNRIFGSGDPQTVPPIPGQAKTTPATPATSVASGNPQNGISAAQRYVPETAEGAHAPYQYGQKPINTLATPSDRLTQDAQVDALAVIRGKEAEAKRVAEAKAAIVAGAQAIFGKVPTPAEAQQAIAMLRKINTSESNSKADLLTSYFTIATQPEMSANTPTKQGVQQPTTGVQQVLGTESPLSPRRGPDMGSQDLIGANTNPLSPGVPSIGRDLAREVLPDNRDEMRRVAQGEIPGTPAQKKVAQDIVFLDDRVQAKTRESLENPARKRQDTFVAGKIKTVTENAGPAFEAIKSGKKLTTADKRALALAGATWRSESEKLALMSDAEARKLQQSYVKWAENASITELGIAGGFDKVADRKLTKYITDAQSTAALMRTKAEAGSEAMKTMLELQKTAMEAVSMEEKNISSIMTTEKKTRAQVLSTYTDIKDRLSLLSKMFFQDDVAVSIIMKKNFGDIMAGILPGGKSGAGTTPSGSEISGTASNVPLTDAQKAAALAEYQGSR